MSDNNLRLQVILNAVDKLTRPFRSAQASSRELAAAVKKSRDAIKQLDQAGSSLDSFRKLQAENQKLGDRLNYARQRANLLSQERWSCATTFHGGYSAFHENQHFAPG